jgi:hypothetical protein
MILSAAVDLAGGRVVSIANRATEAQMRDRHTGRKRVGNQIDLLQADAENRWRRGE